MGDLQNTSTEGTQTGTEGKTFTQDDVNRIVQERLAKERGKGNEELEKRVAELDLRERKLNAVEALRKNGLPDYLVEALNISTDEAFKASMDAIVKLKEETKGSASEPQSVGKIGFPGKIAGGSVGNDPLRSSFGLNGKK